jgi:RNA-binding protein YlmH
MTDTELLKKRFTELAMRSYNSGIFTFTDFLGLQEQAAFEEIKTQLKGIHYEKFGGAVGAERVMIRFGNPEELGYEQNFPISTVKAEPVSQKFADKLTHRDLLGALMNLGIERCTLGDIPIIDNVAYIFANEDIAPFIVSELTKAKRTDLKLSLTDNIPDGELYRTESRTVQLASERLDALIAKLFSLSRDEAQSLFKKRLVFVNGKLIESPSYTPKAEDVVSVRGYGRLIYRSYETTTKKGRLNARVDVYI